MVKQLFSINNFLILLIFFCTGLTIAVAQESDSKIHIKIEKEIDGEKQTIDKTFTDPNDPELKALLKDNDMNIKSKDLDIDVGVEIEEDDDAGNRFNIQLDTDDAESVEEFKNQVQQLADDMGIDIDINQADKQLRIFKYMPGDEDFDMDKLFENLDENVKEWIDMEDLKGNLNNKLKDWDIDLDGLSNSKRPMMGVTIKDVENGVLIENVSDEMGAKEAGLNNGDIIQSIDGKKMENVDQVIEYIADKEAGDFVEVKYERDGKTKKVDVELKANSNFNPQNFKFDDENIKKFNFDSGDMNSSPAYKRLFEQLNNPDFKSSCSSGISITVCKLKDDEKEKLDSFSPNAKLSPLSDLEIGKLDQNFKFSPNPSKGIFNLRFTSDESKQIQINIYDMTGKEVYTESINNFDGSFDKDIDVSGNESGAYILEIVKDNKRFNKKIIIE